MFNDNLHSLQECAAGCAAKMWVAHAAGMRRHPSSFWSGCKPKFRSQALTGDEWESFRAKRCWRGCLSLNVS